MKRLSSRIVAILVTVGLAAGAALAEGDSAAGDEPRTDDRRFALAAAAFKAAETPEEMEAAILMLRAAAREGSLRSQVLLGKVLLLRARTNAEQSEAVELLSKAAEDGDLDAQLVLGRVLAKGPTALRDPSRARALLAAAAEQGSGEASYLLGELSRDDPQSARSDAQAAFHFRRAAERGSPDGQRSLALALLDGAGIDRDEEAALSWLRRAADSGDVESQLHLGRALASRASAIDACDAAARRLVAAVEARELPHSPDAALALAGMYEPGGCYEADAVRTREWLRRAAELGSVGAQLRLARLLAVPAARKAELEEAVFWFGVALPSIRPDAAADAIRAERAATARRLDDDRIEAVDDRAQLWLTRFTRRWGHLPETLTLASPPPDGS